MKWSLKIGRTVGIDVYLHVTFLLMLGLIASAHAVAGGSLTAGLSSITFLMAIFLCVLLHEFGHALAARRYGIRTRDIILLPIGGVANLERIPDKPRQEFWVALAGPLVNVAIAAALGIFLLFTGISTPWTSLSSTTGSFAERLLAVNLFLILFNLLPAFPMDGGRVLRALLAMHTNYARATRIAARTGQAMAVVFGIVALFYNPLLLIIAVFVWTGAAQEARVAELKHSLGGFPVRAAMLTHFDALKPDDHLDRAIELVLRGWQQDFPVMDGERVVGVLTRDGLLAGLRERGPHAMVGEVMREDFLQVEEADLLEHAVFERKAPEFSIVPVTRGSRVVGMLTTDNLGEFLAIRSALNGRNATA